MWEEFYQCETSKTWRQGWWPATLPCIRIKEVTVVTTSPWFIHLYLFSLVPAPTALNLPAVRASASTQGKKGDVRDPQIRKKLYSEVVVSEWLRVHQRAIPGEALSPKLQYCHLVGTVLTLPLYMVCRHALHPLKVWTSKPWTLLCLLFWTSWPLVL